MERTKSTALTAEIVSAYVGNNAVSAADMPGLIGSVFKALTTLGEPVVVPEVPGKLVPVIDPRKSVRPDHVVCLVCGAKQKSLKRHLMVSHELTPEAYREAFGLKRDHPLVAPSYALRRAELARAAGLGKGRTQRRGRRPRG